MKRTVLYGSAGLLVLFVALYFMLRDTSGADTRPAGQVERVVVVTRGNLNLSVSADGVIQPINSVEIKSKASGQIEKLNFEEGQYVEKGELLLELDQRTAKNDYDQSRADLELQEANLAQAENNYRRAEELYRKQLISEQEKDQANVDYVRAKSQLIKARAALSSADERLRDTRIGAPVSGIILTKSVELGQIISSGVSNVGGGTLIATIADMNVVYVETNVDEVDIGRVDVGQAAKVTADAHPEDVFRGVVIRISPLGRTLQNVTTFNVVVQVQNIRGKLKAGMSASVELEVLNKPNVLMVPNEALKDPKSQEGLALLAMAKDSSIMHKLAELELSSARGPGGRGTWKERMQAMSPEEREKFRGQMRERFQGMSQEERQRAFADMARRSGGAGLSADADGRTSTDGTQTGRQAQIGSNDRPKPRLVLVNRGGEFAPCLVMAGASNFDLTEAIDGLQEGEEVLISQVSRAKAASERFTDRMRNRSPLGGGPR